MADNPKVYYEPLVAMPENVEDLRFWTLEELTRIAQGLAEMSSDLTALEVRIEALEP